MIAHLRNYRISPKKANLVAALVRNKKVEDAVTLLKFTNKKAAPVLKKLIESAAANAEANLNQEKENLAIKEIIVTEGPTYKRSIPVSRGRAHPLRKRTSHITVKLNTVETPAKKEMKKTTNKSKETSK